MRIRSLPSTDQKERFRNWLRRTFRRLSTHELELWTLVVGALLLDLGLTIYGIQMGYQEQNLLALRLLQRYGVLGIGGLKVAALGVALSLRILLPPQYAAIPPLGLAVPWIIAGIINLVIIFGN